MVIYQPVAVDFNKRTFTDAEAKKEAVAHLEFACKMYNIQHQGGRLFLHEHPLQASSWDEEYMQKLSALPGVGYVDMDQCQFGQVDAEGNPVKKPTRWISNSQCILQALSYRCTGSGGWCLQGGEWKQHTPCYSKVATAAAV